MNKYRLRAFSFGIIFTVCIIGIYFYYFDVDENRDTLEHEITIDEAKNVIENNGYVVLTEEEINIFKKESEQLKKLQEDKKLTTKKKAPKDKVKTFNLEVKTGMTSNEIADILKKENIIKNKADFIDYLAINGYSKSIQLGSFTLTSKMSYKEIAELITK